MIKNLKFTKNKNEIVIILDNNKNAKSTIIKDNNLNYVSYEFARKEIIRLIHEDWQLKGFYKKSIKSYCLDFYIKEFYIKEGDTVEGCLYTFYDNFYIDDILSILIYAHNKKEIEKLRDNYENELDIIYKLPDDFDKLIKNIVYRYVKNIFDLSMDSLYSWTASPDSVRLNKNIIKKANSKAKKIRLYEIEEIKL